MGTGCSVCVDRAGTNWNGSTTASIRSANKESHGTNGNHNRKQVDPIVSITLAAEHCRRRVSSSSTDLHVCIPASNLPTGWLKAFVLQRYIPSPVLPLTLICDTTRTSPSATPQRYSKSPSGEMLSCWSSLVCLARTQSR